MSDGYSIFTPVQGPQIDVQLFGQAAEAGAKLGQEIPNPITSAITGAQAGYETGQKEALRAAEISTQSAEAQIENLKAANATETNALQLDATKAKLTNDLAQSTDEINTRQASDQLLQQFQSADPETQKSLVFGAQSASVFAKNPALRQDLLTQLYTSGSLSPDEQAGVGQMLRLGAIDAEYGPNGKQALANQQKYTEAEADWLHGKGQGLVSTISNTLKVPADNAAAAVKFVDAGSLKIDPVTKRVQLDNNGNEVANDATTLGALRGQKAIVPGTKDVISTAPDSKGQVVAEGVSKDEFNAYANYQRYKNIQTGAQAQFARRVLFQNRAGGQTSQTPATKLPTYNSDSPKEAPKEAPEEDPFSAFVRQNLGANDAQMKAAGPALDSLKATLHTYKNNPTTRNDPVTLQSINSSILHTARAMSDAEFDNNPALQAQYTQDTVDAHNKALDNAADVGAFSALPPSSRQAFSSVMSAFRVQSPKDLYFQSQRNVITPRLTQIVLQGMEDTRQADVHPAVKNAVQTNTLSYLSAVALRGN